MTNMRSLPLYALASALLCTAAMAQSSAPAVRIVSPIDESQLVALRGNVNPRANAENDRGPVSPSLPMADMTLVLSRSAEQQAAFNAYVTSEYDPGSPDYHQWLTPAEIGERFGPAETDIATITGWLTSHGFTVTDIPHDRMSIHFTGTAAQAESAFHMQIHNLSVHGVAHIANMTDPQIPAALAPVVLGIKGLHNFLPHPMHKLGGKVQFNQQMGKWQRVTTAAASSTAAPALANSGGLRPQFGVFTPASGNYFANLEEDVAPYDFATIYNVLPLWNNSINGANQTIAIVGTSDLCLGQSGSPCNSVNDVAAFRSAFGLPAGPTPEEVKGANGIDPGVCSTTSSTAPCSQGDLLENSLDVEWSGAVAPSAQIVLVTSGYNSTNANDITNDPLYQDAQYVIDNHGDSSYPMVSGVTILSMSYGECELLNGTSSNVAYNNLWQSAAAEGISVFVSAGDSGSASCDDDEDQYYGNPYSAQLGLTVSGQASTPYNTAVGGTDFSWCQPTYNSSGSALNGCPDSLSSPGPYWNTSNSGTTGESAKGYVPETPWNDTCTNPIWFKFIQSLAPLAGYSTPGNAEAACNLIQNDWEPIYENDGIMFAYLVDAVGGSGGPSNCVANNADTYTGTGVPSCTSGATSTGATTNPTTGDAQASLTLYNDGWPKPSWQNTSIPGMPNDGVRDLPDVSFFAGDGSLNSATLVCASLVADAACSASASGNGATTMLEVGGTSVGTPEMAGVMALINQKVGSPQGLANKELYTLAAQQTYSSCSAESGTTSSSCYFNDVDQGTNAMSCDYNGEAGEGGAFYENGSWAITGASQGLASPNCAALNSGDTVGTLVSSGTTPGYNAGVGYDLATGLGSLNVANVVDNWTSDAGTGKATLTVTPNSSSAPINIAADASLTFSITVTGSGATPTGSVTVAGGGYGATQSLTSGAAAVVIPANSLAPGSQTLTVTYSGDINYATTNATESVTVAADSPTVTVNAPATQNAHNSFNVTVSVSGPVGAPIPSGSVNLSGGGYSGGTAQSLNSSGSATFTIPANSLTIGSDTLTATYIGNSTYAQGTGSATVVISSAALATPTVVVTPGSNPIDSSQALGLTVKVSGASGTPTGTVTLTSPSLNPAPTATLDVTGAAQFSIPANSLASGTDSLTVSYSGDGVYAAATQTASVTVTQSTYALTAGAPSPSTVNPGSSSTVTISGGTSNTDYSGTVTLNSCTLTSSTVTSPNSPPTCSVSGTITYTAGTPSGSATATVTTTAASFSEMAYPKPAGKGKGWLGAGGGAMLAFLVFLGIPARRRSWRTMLGMVVLLVGLGSLSACGGGGSSSGSGGTAISATSAGSYTFTVSGTSSPTVATAPTATFTVTVN